MPHNPALNKPTQKQLAQSQALERRKQMRRLNRGIPPGAGGSLKKVNNETLDEMSLSNKISRIISMLPGSKRKRPQPLPMKDTRTTMYRRFPLPAPPQFTPWFVDNSDNLSDELRHFMEYVNVSSTLYTCKMFTLHVCCSWMRTRAEPENKSSST